MFCGGDCELLPYTALSSGVWGPNLQIHEEALVEKASSIRRFGEVDLNAGGWLLSGSTSYFEGYLYSDIVKTDTHK